MRLKYVERTCKSSRAEILSKVCEEEIEYLRKECFKYKRRKFLSFPFTIEETTYDSYRTLGNYDWDDKNNKHVIKISKSILWGCQKGYFSTTRQNYLKELHRTVRHELVHAFVQEQFGHLFKMCTADASPVFLSVLHFVNATTGHRCNKAFTKTDLYKTIKKCKTYEELEDKLIELIFEFRQKTRKFERIEQIDQFGNIAIVENEFQFAYENPGLSKDIDNVAIYTMLNENKITNGYIGVKTWEIGCNVKAEQLDYLMCRKYDSNNVEHYLNKTKVYMYKNNKNEPVEKRIKIKEIKNSNLKI